MSSSGEDNIELQGGPSGGGGGGLLSPDGPDAVYQTKYQKSLRHYITRERLPDERNYDDLQDIVGGGRPTLDDLHNATYRDMQKSGGDDMETGEPAKKGKVVKFGWIEGVYMRCLLNIWGVMLFLRLTWVIGEAGLVQALLIVCLGNVVTFITSLSMSAVATNGRIAGGGVYYMISRSLGPEFGGSIGLMFTLANSIAAATYIIGFVESLQDMIGQYWNVVMVDGGINDIRAIGTATLVLVLLLAIVGMDWVTKVQMGLLVLLIAAQFDFVIGVFMGPTDTDEKARGFIGFDSELFEKNVNADYRHSEGKDQGFFTVFAVFFTAVTGIVAGANLSGDLKDPSYSIPKGTLLAIVTTFITYIVYPFLIAATVARDANGNQTYFDDWMKDTNGSVVDWPGYSTGPSDNETLYPTCEFDSDGESICEYGMQNSFQVVELISGWGPLIYLGTFAATLSSAIASLVGAPRVLQALAKDRLYPYIHVFEKGVGANNDPVRGYVLVFVISFAMIMIGSLNAVSSLLSNFFLASYCLINFSCFHASLIKSPGWRPSFKYYNMWISLFGSFMCLAVMFLIDWVTALITFVVTVALYLFVSYRKPENTNWGSSTQAAQYVSALKSTLDLNMVEEHVKNYRPQILILSGTPGSRPPLIDLGSLFTKNLSLLVCGHVIKGPSSQKVRNAFTRQANNWMRGHKIRAFYNIVEGEDLEKGALSLFQLAGLGKLKPNMVLMGYKANWNKCDRAELKAYFNTLHEALDMYLGIVILRAPQGLDFSHIVEDENVPTVAAAEITHELDTQDKDGEGITVEGSVPGSGEVADGGLAPENVKHRKNSISNLYKGTGGTPLNKDVLNNITFFQRKQGKGTIDVWWLYDDGGLTLLLPYLLTQRSQWSDCKLRIFALANRRDELDMEQRSMANLLSKFRIDYSDVIVIPDVAKKAQESSKMEFDQLIEEFKEKRGDDETTSINDAEIEKQKEKTNRHLRLRELLLENSTKASSIIMTLPMPRKGSVSAPMFMAWLETLTRGMPPFILIRGNQTSVLTYRA